MRVPRRHRFPAPAPPAQLFARLPERRRFRFASGASAATVFGADPVAVLEMDGARALEFEPLRAMLPRVPATARDVFPGGAVGFLPYEAGFANERLVAPRIEPGVCGWFGVYDTFAVWRPDPPEVEVVSWGLGPDGAFDEKTALRRATE